MSTAHASHERWQRLQHAGIVDGPMPAPIEGAAPWYVSAMVGFAAWLAALFLIAFFAVAIGNFVRQPIVAIVVGAVVIAVAAFFLRNTGTGTFLSQLALAFSLAGQGLVCAGLLFASGENLGVSLTIFALVEIALVVSIAHAAHRLLATLAAALSIAFLAGWLGVQPLYLPLALAAFVVVQRGMLVASRLEALWRPVGYGIALALLVAWSVTIALRGVDLTLDGDAVRLRWLPTFATFALAGVAAAAGAVLARESAAQPRTVIAAALALCVVALAAKAIPAVPVALVILLFAFATWQRALFGIGAIGLVAALVHHYWRLDTTLLAKSSSLALLGVTLAIGYVAVRRWPAREERDAA